VVDVVFFRIHQESDGGAIGEVVCYNIVSCSIGRRSVLYANDATTL